MGGRHQRLLCLGAHVPGGGKSIALLKITNCGSSVRTHHAVHWKILVKDAIQKMLNPTDLVIS